MDDKKKVEGDALNLASVPTPDQLPTPVDVSSWEPQLMRSEPVDKLLRHNDDLMARLSVNLRRVSFLEGRADSLHKNNLKLAKHCQALKDQFLIEQERAQKLNFRYQKHGTSLQQLEQKIKNYEAQCAQLQALGEGHKNDFKTQQGRFLKYKTRVGRLARQALAGHKKLQSENKILQDSVLDFEKKHQQTLQNLKDTRRQFDTEMQKMEFKHQSLKDENTQLKAGLHELQQLRQDNAKIKEQLHETNTKHQLLKAKTIKEVANANNIVTHYKSKIDIYKYECERLQNLLDLHQKAADSQSTPRAAQPSAAVSLARGSLATARPQEPVFEEEPLLANRPQPAKGPLLAEGPLLEDGGDDILNSDKLQAALKQIRQKIQKLAD